MGPFEGAGISLFGILFFAMLAMVIWLFNRGRADAAAKRCPRCKKAELIFFPLNNAWLCPSTDCAAAQVNHDASKGAPPGMEYALICDKCGAEAQELLRHREGPDLCKTCFGSTSTPPASNKTSSPSGTSG